MNQTVINIVANPIVVVTSETTEQPAQPTNSCSIM